MAAARTDQAEEPAWQHDVMRVLKRHDVKHVVYVPDAGHSAAIGAAEADPDIKSVVLKTEEEGIDNLSGAWLCGEPGVPLMQSSGVSATESIHSPCEPAPVSHCSWW
jgi:sulfopyruvate decarboxylase TPP-binding subunit